MKKKLLIASLVLFVVMLVAGISTLVVKANAGFFVRVSTSSATSTVGQIVTSGTTQTLTFNTYALGRPYSADSAVLLVQATGSSTASVVGVGYQYSDNGIDWYSDNLALPTATTTTQINNTTSYTWALGTTATTSRALTIPTPTQYVKATFTATGANSYIWASIVAKQQSL